MLYKYFRPDLSHVTTYFVKLGCFKLLHNAEMHHLQL